MSMRSMNIQADFRRAHRKKIAIEKDGQNIPYAVCPVCSAHVESSTTEMARKKLSTHVYYRHRKFYKGILKFDGFEEPGYFGDGNRLKARQT